MNQSFVVKEQFNKQAGNFDNWSLTQNEKIYQSLYNFFGVEPQDRLLDVACGTGAFSVYAAQRTKDVWGVDISEGMIGIAEEHVKQRGLQNTTFLCCDVQEIPLPPGSFDCVVSKSAFHHMREYKRIFAEMVKCCKKGGRLGLHDVILYDDEEVDGFFEELEMAVDASHHFSLSAAQIVELYRENNIAIYRVYEAISELNFHEYLNHAVQSEEDKKKIERMLNMGLKDKKISSWLVQKNGVLYWRRKTFTVAGRK